MKGLRIFTTLILLLCMLVATTPTFAQLGGSTNTWLKIQNVSGGQVQVTVQFISRTGTSYTPSCFDDSSPCTNANPFYLNDAVSKYIDVGAIPSLPVGYYSSVVSANGKVIVEASLSVDTANASISNLHFDGSYTGFDGGASTVYLPTSTHNFYGWYSTISVMNIGASATTVTVTITCTNPESPGTQGTLSKSNLGANQEYTWNLKYFVPTGFSASTECRGGAVITATGSQPVVAVNYQTHLASGKTNAFDSMTSGSSTVYIPQLNSDYYGWVSALNILKIESGSTTVTIAYSDEEESDTCSLTDSAPSCQLMMNQVHSTGERFSATITSSPAKNLLASVGSSSTSGFSGGYNGFNSGSHAVAAPLAMKSWYNWTSALNCMNVSPISTTLQIAYEGFTPYSTTTTLYEGDSEQITLANDSHLDTSNWNGSIIITANAANANIACMIGSSNTSPPDSGDYALQYIGLPK